LLPGERRCSVWESVVADVNNLQAIIGRSSGKARFAILLFTIEDARRAKEFLRTWKSEVPSGLAQEQDGVSALHLLFSWSALEREALEGAVPAGTVRKGACHKSRSFGSAH
jgi:hypothetical protein